MVGLITSVESEVYSLRFKSTLSHRGPKVVPGQRSSAYSNYVSPIACRRVRESIESSTSDQPDATEEMSSSPQRKLKPKKGHYGLILEEEEPLVDNSILLDSAKRIESTHKLSRAPSLSGTEITPIKRVSFDRSPNQMMFLKAMMESIDDNDLNQSNVSIAANMEQHLDSTPMQSMRSDFLPPSVEKSPKRTDALASNPMKLTSLAPNLDIDSQTRTLLDEVVEYKLSREAALIASTSAVDSHYNRLVESERKRVEDLRVEASTKEISLQLAMIIDPNNDSIDVGRLETLVAAASNGVDTRLCNDSASLLEECKRSLHQLQDSMVAYRALPNATNHSIVTAFLDSKLGKQLKDHDVVEHAKQSLLDYPVREEEPSAVDPSENKEDNQFLEEKSTSVPHTNTNSEIVFEFEYIKQAEMKIKWYSSLSDKFGALPDSLRATIMEIVPRLLHVNTADFNKIDRASLVVYNICQEIFSTTSGLDDTSIMFIISYLLESIIRLVLTTSEDASLIYAYVLQGVYMGLGNNLQTLFSTMLIPILNKIDPRCIPDMTSSSSLSSSSSTKLIELVGALVETEIIVNIDASYGWSWLVRACKQLYALSSTSDTQLSMQTCDCITVFLRTCHSCIRKKYCTKFVSILTEVIAIVNKLVSTSAPDGSNMKSCVGTLQAIFDGKIVSSLTFCGYSSLALRKKILIGSLRKFVNGALEIENSHHNEKQHRIESVGLDALEGEFNKLGPSPDSQQRVLNGLITIANRAGSDTTLVNYTLYKVSNEIVLRSTSQFFSISSGHALPLARIVCELCKVKRDIGDLIKALFYITCPLAIPCFEDQLNPSSEEYLVAMGYEKIVDSKTSAEIWETREKWMSRQMKVLVTFFTIMVQPEQYPLTLDDGYAWLTTLINYCHATVKLPVYIANLFDHVLRTISMSMYQKYGKLYLNLLKMIHTQIIPLLDTSLAKAKIESKRLTQFIEHALLNNGKDFLTLQ